MSRPEPISLFRPDSARRAPETGPTRNQRLLAIGIWLVAVVIALIVNRAIDWRGEWPMLAILFLFYLLPVLLSVRLPGGIYVGFINGGILTVALVGGYDLAMLVVLAGSLLIVVTVMLLTRVLHLPRAYHALSFYESIYASATHSLGIFLAGWLCQQWAGGAPLDILASFQNLPAFVIMVGIYLISRAGSESIWLALGGISPLSHLVRYLQLLISINYASVALVPLITFVYSYNQPRFMGLIFYAFCQVALYGVANTYIALTGRVFDLSQLNSIGQTLSANLELGDLLAALRREIGKLLDVSGFFLALYDEQTGLISFLVDYEEDRQVHFDPISIDGESVTAHIIRNRQAFLVDQVTMDASVRLGIEPVGQLPRSFVGVPIWAGKHIIGAMGLRNYQRGHAFTRDDLRLLEAVAQQAGVALQNAHLYQRSRRQASELTSLNKLSSLLSSTLELDQMIHTVCTVVVEVMGYHKVAVFLFEDDGTQAHLVDSIGLSEGARDASTVISLIDTQSEARHSIAIEDIQTDPQLKELQWMTETAQMRAVLEVPLRIDERIIGSLAGYYSQVRRIPPDEIEMMETLAGQIAVALENARLFESIRARSRELETLYDTSSAISASLSLKHVLKTLSISLLKALNVSGCATWLAVEDGLALCAVLRMVATRKGPRERAFGTRTLYLDSLPLIVTAIERHDVCLLQADDPHLMPSEQHLLDHSGIKAGLALPLRVRSHLVGLMVMPTLGLEGEIRPEQARLAESLVNQAAIAIENARLFERTDVALDQRLGEISALEKIAQRMASQLDLKSVIEQIATAAIGATRAEYVDVGLLAERAHTFQLIIRHDSEENTPLQWPADRGIVSRALRMDTVVNVGDVRSDPDYIKMRNKVRSEMVVPIILTGKHLGVINLESVRLNAFTIDHARFVTNLAEHAAIAIANARLYEAAERRAEDFSTLRSIALDLLSSPNLVHSLQLIVDSAVSQEGVMGCCVYLYDPVSECLTFESSKWLTREENQEILLPGLDNQAISIAQTGEKVLIEDLTVGTLHVNVAGVPTREPLKTLIGIPLKPGSDVRGVFVAALAEGAVLRVEALNFLDLLAAQAAAAIGNALLTEQTRVSRDRLQAVLDSSHDGILMFTMNSRLEIANPRAEYLLNLKIRDYIGLPILDIVRQVNRELQRSDEFASLAKTTEILRDIRQDPFAITRRTYSVSGFPPHAVEETSMAVAGHDGILLGRLFVLRDITQELEIEAFRKEMSHMIVHDLRSPLAGTVTGLELALEEIELAPDHPSANTLRLALTVARDNSNALLRMIEAILDVNKLESGEVPLMLAPVSLKVIAEGACDKLQGLANGAQISVQIEVPETLPDIVADAEKIERVFVNLLDNALKYTPRGGQIVIQIETTATHQQVSVIDGGDGIPLEDRERIFDRFVQIAGSARKRGPKGTGLGLTFCRLAVEAHRGRIWVGDGPTGGAAFYFSLPVEWSPRVPTKP